MGVFVIAPRTTMKWQVTAGGKDQPEIDRMKNHFKLVNTTRLRFVFLRYLFCVDFIITSTSTATFVRVIQCGLLFGARTGTMRYTI